MEMVMGGMLVGPGYESVKPIKIVRFAKSLTSRGEMPAERQLTSEHGNVAKSASRGQIKSPPRQNKATTLGSRHHHHHHHHSRLHLHQVVATFKGRSGAAPSQQFAVRCRRLLSIKCVSAR